MKRVFKYPLGIAPVQGLELPACSEILHVGRQGEGIMLWALVDPDTRSKRMYVIELAGTGHALLDRERRHIATFEYGPGLVLHAFEVLS